MLHRERERLDCLLSRDFGSFALSAESMGRKTRSVTSQAGAPPFL
jgi:hypothetical protein